MVVGHDDRFVEAVEFGAYRFRHLCRTRPLRKQGDKRILDRGGSRLILQRRGRSAGEDASVVHRNQPVEALGLLHVGRRDDHAHARPAAGAQPVDQIPELAA
jgi:hypothetical protein